MAEWEIELSCLLGLECRIFAY